MKYMGNWKEEEALPSSTMTQRPLSLKSGKYWKGQTYKNRQKDYPITFKETNQVQRTIIPAHEQYEGVRRLINHEVRIFQRQYGGEWEDLLSDAHLAFAEAVFVDDPQRAQFSTHFYTRLRGRLIDGLRNKLGRTYPKFDRTVPLGESDPSCPDYDRFSRFLADLSEDAKMMVLILIHQPEQINRNKLHAAVTWLLGLGWSGDRIQMAIMEIKENLQ
jgi:hypothetical protein